MSGITLTEGLPINITRHSLSKDKRTGVYFARIQYRGVRKKFWFTKNYRKSKQQLRQLEDDLASGNKSFMAFANTHIDHTTPGDIKIADLVQLYLDWLLVNRSKMTWETNQYLLRPFLEYCGECMVSDLNMITLTKYYAMVKRQRGKSENGGNHHIRQVKTLIRWGEQMEICISPVRRFPSIREAPSRTKKFTDEELVLLLKKLHPDFRDMIVFGLMTGLRPQELRGLRRANICKVETCWSIVLQRHKTTLSAEIAQPRCVPLSSEAVEIIKRQYQAYPESDSVFLNHHGRPYTADGFRQRLKRACSRAGIEPKPPYALRHYFGTKRAAAGLNQTILAQIMGHTKLQTTSRYIAAVPEYHQKALQAMAQDVTELLCATAAEDKTGLQVVRKWSGQRMAV